MKSKILPYLTRPGCAFLIGNLYSSPTFAATGGFQVVNILQSLIQLLNSEIARVIFVLAIMGVGYGWLYMGRIPKERAVGAIVGIGIVFSASYIAQKLGVGI